MVSGLKRPKLEVKPFPKLLKALFLKARESAVVHQRDEVHELSIMLSHCEVSLYGISYIELIWFGLIVAAHNVDELFGQLEVCTFEPHVLARGPVEDEAEIDVNNVPCIIYHDVPIVPVFNLENVANHGVGRETFYEVKARHLEFTSVFIPKLLQEVLVKIYLKGFSELVSAV